MEAIEKTRDSGIPVFCTEFSYQEDGWTSVVLEGCRLPSEWCEKNDISWMDWMSWNATDQGRRVKWIVPDAQKQGYVWWDTDVGLSEPKPAPANLPMRSGSVAQANGRTIARLNGAGDDVELSVLPGSAHRQANRPVNTLFGGSP